MYFIRETSHDLTSKMQVSFVNEAAGLVLKLLPSLIISQTFYTKMVVFCAI
jgi:hypothetical protein